MRKSYLLAKLSEINFRMAIHEGNANQRLASEAPKILHLPVSKVPEPYKKGFDKLIDLVKNTIHSLSSPELIPIKIRGIQNRTAVKYIKLLIDIEKRLDVECDH